MKISIQILTISLLIGVVAVANARPLQAHVTRSDHWAYSPNNPISYFEWLEFAKKEQGIFVSGPYTTLVHPVTQQHIPLVLERGQITVHMPDIYVIEKMKKIALKLNAVLQDDYGNTYEEQIDSLQNENG